MSSKPVKQLMQEAEKVHMPQQKKFLIETASRKQVVDTP